MNRDIRFNAWLPEVGYMMEDVAYGHGQIGFPALDQEEFHACLKTHGFGPEECNLPDWLFDTGEDWYYITDESKYILLQFTGLKDRNSIDLFEGDIVQEDFPREGGFSSIGVFEFYEGSFGSRNEHDRLRIPALFTGPATQGMNLNYYNKIGNKFQNPELIRPCLYKPVRLPPTKKLSKDANHTHYWISGGILHESYRTIRGIRYRILLEVPGMLDNNNLIDTDVAHIEATFLNKTSNE